MVKDTKALLLIAFALGAGAMYVLDPDRGRRRRALIRDQVTHGGNLLENVGVRATGVSRDLRNRARGAVAEVRSHLSRDEAGDAVIEARVHSELGRKLRHHEALTVSVYNGKVTLRGTLTEEDANRAVAAARGVRGVSEVEDLLQIAAAASG
jgi:hypothetical protein